jgi:hypothetical protein
MTTTRQQLNLQEVIAELWGQFFADAEDLVLAAQAHEFGL